MTDSPLRVAPSILLLEADPDNRSMYTLYFESQGACVQPATTAADVLARLRDAQLRDVLIFDVVGLDMPAAEFCEAVRQIPRRRPLRLILVTGWLLSHALHATLLRLDVVVHQKPCSLDSLWTTLQPPFSEAEWSRGDERKFSRRGAQSNA
jgi:CheY-like chemotaxis protein